MKAKDWLLGALLALAGGAAQAETVKYFHTDALGSVVAVTDENGAVIERREYEPYGLQLTPAVQDGPGYTGHVQDKATGLVYAQQRYYDPGVGRFLSVDPVTADGGDMRHFNRYAYAYNNPYKFKDLDGRCPVCIPIAIIAWRAYSAYDTVTTAADNVSTLTDANASGMDKALAGAELAGSAAGGKLGRETAGAMAKLTKRVADKVSNATNRVPKPPTGKGSVPPSDRDPKRVWTKQENAEKLQQQGGNCANCGQATDIDNAKGHHIKRHADGGKTVPENHAVVCDTCHTDLHRKNQ